MFHGYYIIGELSTVLLIKFLPSLPVTAQRGSAPSATYPPERATSGIATCSVVGDTFRPVAKLSLALGWWTLPCLACLWARVRVRPAKQSAEWRNTVTNVYTMDLEAHFIWIANEITITFVLMQFMLISNEIQINFISISREIHMNFSRTEREIRTVKLHSNFIWTSCELHINFIWNAY